MHPIFELMFFWEGYGSLCVNVWETGSVEHYAVVIHDDPEGGYWAEAPALPGCYSQGETIEELKQNIREAIAGVLEVLQDRSTRDAAVQG